MKNFYKFIFSTLICAFLFLTGCGYEMNANVTENSADVSYNFYLTTKEESSILSNINKKAKAKYSSFEEFAQSLGLTKNKTKKISQKTHNSYTISTTYDANEYDNIFIHFDKKYATISADDVTKKIAANYKSYVNIKNTKLDCCVFTIKYPYKVYKANGTIKKDGYTVSYNLSKKKSYDKRFWAVFSSKTSTKPSIKGLKANTKYYNKTLKLSLSTVASAFSINGNEQYSDSCTLENEGKYNLKVVSTSGKKTTKEIIIDKTKPTTNAKNTTYNKKIKIAFSDKLSGIKSAKLNNKNIKSNTVISKAGKYTLVIIDNAGNKKSVQFVLK